MIIIIQNEFAHACESGTMTGEQRDNESTDITSLVEVGQGAATICNMRYCMSHVIV